MVTYYWYFLLEEMCINSSNFYFQAFKDDIVYIYDYNFIANYYT